MSNCEFCGYPLIVEGSDRISKYHKKCRKDGRRLARKRQKVVNKFSK